MTYLVPAQRERAAAVLLGAACGDALGVPYEFARPLTMDQVPAMLGGGLGPYAPGEYSDDTQMAVCIAAVAATGADLRSEAAQDGIAQRFLDWLGNGASDVGAQTRGVLTMARREHNVPLAQAMRTAAAHLHERTGRSAGNGSLMRTAPVALAYLDAPSAMVEAARAVSGLTHHDDLAGDACVLWCEGIRLAVLEGTFAGVRDGLHMLPPKRRDQWAGWLAEAETKPPNAFTPNGFVVTALQAAWSASTRTPIKQEDPLGGDHLRRALVAAVRAGNDTDTVAAIAGALLAARWGLAAIPADWRAQVHGWPGLDSDDLIRLAEAIPAAHAPA